MNKEILATILGVASLSLVKKMGSPSKLMRFYNNPEPVEAVIKGNTIVGKVDNLKPAIEGLQSHAKQMMELSEKLQNLTEIHPNNTSVEDFVNFLNDHRKLIDVAEAIDNRIVDIGTEDENPVDFPEIKEYILLLYNLKSIQLVFPKNGTIDADGVVNLDFHIHCAFKFTNTAQEIKSMCDRIDYLMSITWWVEKWDFDEIGSLVNLKVNLSDMIQGIHHTEIDPQNKLPEKIRNYVFGTTSSQLRRF